MVGAVYLWGMWVAAAPFVTATVLQGWDWQAQAGGSLAAAVAPLPLLMQVGMAAQSWKQVKCCMLCALAILLAALNGLNWALVRAHVGTFA